jgi:hypothetical protein
MKTLCSLWGTNRMFMYVAGNFRLQKQANSCRLLTTGTRVRSQPSTCDISGRPSGTVTEFFSQYFGFPLLDPFRHCSLLIFYLNTTFIRRTSGRIPGIFKQRWRCFGHCFQPLYLRVLRFVAKVFSVWRRNRSRCRSIWNMQLVTGLQTPCTCSRLQAANKNTETLVSAS